MDTSYAMLRYYDRRERREISVLVLEQRTHFKQMPKAE
jgi:hypothetical protein